MTIKNYPSYKERKNKFEQGLHWCNECNQYLDKCEFCKNNKNLFGYEYICINCKYKDDTIPIIEDEHIENLHRCTCCRQLLSLDEFYKNNNYKIGYTKQCKKCISLAAKKDMLC